MIFTESTFAFSNKKKAAEKFVEEQEKSKQDSSETQGQEVPTEGGTLIGGGNSTKLPGASKNYSYFNKIDSDIIKLVENGSPDSLKTAMAKFKKTESEYADNEKVLVAVASYIMETVWPSVRQTWVSYPAPDDNPYIGAINSARNGVFDSSTGNTDFLSTLLPCLVLMSSKTGETVLDQCEQAITAALKENETSVLANYLAGILYERKNDKIRSENYYKIAYENSKDTKEICLAYSKILSESGKNELAAKVVETIAKSNQNDLQVLKQNAYLSFKNRDYSAAEQYVAKVLQQTPNDLEFVLFRAKIFVEKSDYIHAVSLLDMYARQNDSDLDYLVLRSRVQLEWSKNAAAATETIEKALRLYPDSEDALMIAAKLSSSTDAPVAGKYADELAQMVLSKNPQNTEALKYALDGLVLRENWNSAYEISKDLIAKLPSDPELIMRHVTVCIKLGKKNEAFDVATKAYNSNKNDETIIQTYVYAYCQVSSRDSSLSLINNLMNNSSSKIKSYLYYQRSFLQRGEDSQLADLRSSLIANPRNTDALFRLYEIYYGKKDYRKAQYYLKQVVAINPNDSTTKKLNETLTQLIQ